MVMDPDEYREAINRYHYSGPQPYDVDLYERLSLERLNEAQVVCTRAVDTSYDRSDNIFTGVDPSTFAMIINRTRDGKTVFAKHRMFH